MFIVEVQTTQGPRCERFETQEEAIARIEQLTRTEVIGLPMLFQELPDGSQRLVREDGKPLQWHRLPDDSSLSLTFPTDDEPLPVVDEALPGTIRQAQRPPMDDIDDEPLPLLD